MQIDSVGLKTELIFTNYIGDFASFSDFCKISTPSNPDYYFGNFILFNAAPNASQINEYIAIFQTQFADNPNIRHTTLMWPPTTCASKDVQNRFVEMGYEFNQDSVLSCRQTRVTSLPSKGVVNRILASDSDWDAALEIQVLCRDPSYEEAAYRAFKSRQMDNYRAMQNDGLGNWYGAFIADKMVANMGIYHGDKVSCFQLVGTHPGHRRKGICTQLVHHVSQDTNRQFANNDLVIIAEAGEPAERIYKQLGFSHVETLEAVCLRPQ